MSGVPAGVAGLSSVQQMSRAYPSQYASSFVLKDGTKITIRPIRPEDEPLMVQFHGTLSERSVYLRYFCSMSLRTRVDHKRLVRICSADYDRQIPLVADRQDPKTAEHAILAVGRLSKLESGTEAEVAVLVSDAWQRKGLGSEMLRRVVDVARAEGLKRVSGELLRDNLAMQVLLKRAGFRLHMLEDATSLRGTLDL